jgi:DNA-binding transcriptional ArsR family regulator
MRLNASDISRASARRRTTVSRHLKRPCEAGVLECSRQGREVPYRLQAESLIGHLQDVIDYLECHR